jgi:metallo-beta-lactamase family protein
MLGLSGDEMQKGFNMTDIKIKFCGAARHVTGSCYLLQTPQSTFLVDCGLFQGSKKVRALNYEPFPFQPQDVDFVLQTHAHIDHSGQLPKLTSTGFKGKIFATEGTRDLLTFMLPDSGYIQEMEVEHRNRRNQRRGKPEVAPIYTRKDAEDCLAHIVALDYEDWVQVGPDVRARFWNAGHILGSASIEVEIDQEDAPALRLLFSGDIGPDNKLFHPDPDAPADFDYVISESTYGNRERPETSVDARRAALQTEVARALAGDGMLLIPVFAVERTQELITDILALQKAGDIPSAPIFLDSPLAIRVTRVFQKHSGDLEDLSVSPQLLNSPQLHPTQTTDESKSIAKITGGAIILAASGMCDAGRIRHHLKQWLWQEKATVLFVGYQAQGSMGRRISEGAKRVTIQGEDIKINAKIRKLDAYSGHADGAELASWISERKPIQKALILTHGEEDQMDALHDKVIALGIDARRIVMPALDDEMVLSAAGSLTLVPAQEQRVKPAKPKSPDWDNDLAELVNAVRDGFHAAADDKARAVFVRQLRKSLDLDKAG